MQYMDHESDTEVQESSDVDAGSARGEDAHRASPPTKRPFKDLVRTYYGDLIVYARKLTGERAMAEDIVHDALICAQDAWARWEPAHDPEHSACAWLRLIVFRTFSKAIRYQKLRRRKIAQQPHDVVSATHGDRGRILAVPPAPVDSPIGDQVMAAIDRLSQDHRAVVMLVYVEGLPCDEVAERLGIARGTVFSRLDRARVILQKFLKDYALDEYHLLGDRGPRVGAAEAPERPKTDARRVDRVVARDDASALVAG